MVDSLCGLLEPWEGFGFFFVWLGFFLIAERDMLLYKR